VPGCGVTLHLPGIPPKAPKKSALQKASAPDCPPDELRRLGESRDAKVRAAVAENPACPLDLLLKLAPEFPERFARNPALQLHLIEHPGLLARTAKVLGALAQVADLPPWLLDLVVDESRGAGFLEKILAEHPALTPEQVSRLCLAIEPETRGKASAHPRAPRELLDLLVLAGSTPDLKQITPRRRKPIDEATLRRVAALGPWGAQLAASHPRAPRGLLEELACHEEISVRCALASNRRTPLDILENLACDQFSPLCLQALRSPNMTEDAIRRVAQRRPPGDEIFVYSLATPADMLASFVAHPTARIRRQVAYHPNTPPEIIEALAGDPESEVRGCVAGRPDLSLATLQALACDRDKYTKDEAKKRLTLRLKTTPKTETAGREQAKRAGRVGHGGQ